MNLCQGSWGGPNAHDEIAYDGKQCPACEALMELDDTRKELKQAIADRDKFENDAMVAEAALEERRTNIRAMIDEVQTEIEAKEKGEVL